MLHATRLRWPEKRHNQDQVSRRVNAKSTRLIPELAHQAVIVRAKMHGAFIVAMLDIKRLKLKEPQPFALGSFFYDRLRPAGSRRCAI